MKPALGALRRLPFPDGATRLRVFKKLVSTYSGVEAMAGTSSNDPKYRAKREFWAAVGVEVIDAAQYLASHPTDSGGNLYRSLEEFMTWLRKHKNPRKPPWADPK